MRLIREGPRSHAKKIRYAFGVLRGPSSDFADRSVFFVTRLKLERSRTSLHSFRSCWISNDLTKMSTKPRATFSVMLLDEFRPLQKEIISTALEEKDVLVLMPTDGGKSLRSGAPPRSLENLPIRPNCTTSQCGARHPAIRRRRICTRGKIEIARVKGFPSSYRNAYAQALACFLVNRNGDFDPFHHLQSNG